MNKIIAGIEPIDTNTGFPLPNMCDPNYFKEGAEYPYPLTLGRHMFNELKSIGYAPFGNIVDYVPVTEITSQNYFYIVDVFSTTFFTDNEKNGFKYVNTKVLEDVRSKKCQLIISNPTEGMSGIKGISQEFDFKILEQWCIDYNIPTKSVHYVHGNLLSKEIARNQGCTFNVYPISIQECWNNINAYPEGGIKYYPNKMKPYLYLNYNRQPRFHRVLLLSRLIKDGLFDLGLNSFNSMDRSAKWFEPMFKETNQLQYYDVVEDLFSKSPIIVDTDNSNITSSAGNIDNYTQTFMSIITETLVDEGTLFCSEKTWRSIIAGHPFVILAGKGMLAYLKSQGFKTFSEWIDEDYDNKDNWIDRIEHITNELKRLSKYSFDELIQIRKEMEPVLIHNKNVMRERLVNKFNHTHSLKPIEDIMLKIQLKTIGLQWPL